MEMQMETSYVFTVVVTGLVVVFIGLIILIAFVWLMGKLFDYLKASKDNKEKAAVKTEKPVAPAPVAASSVPEVEDGISDEVVAVIAAAVAAMTGSSCAVKSIKRSGGKASRRTAWGAQGINESTRVF